jgi:hypothetical protein
MKLGIMLLQVLCSELIALCLFVAFRFVSLESAITLSLFTFLFGSLTFQLTGSFHRKLCLLTLGNLLGLFWNFVFFYFSSAGTMLFGKTFGAAYTIIYPFLNLLWVVPFWSLSIGFLHRAQNSPVEGDVPFS